MTNKLIIVTGYFGAPIEETARELAEAKAFAYLSLDEEITRRDGRSISRLVMMNGEHGYRNQEYEILNEINEDPGAFLAERFAERPSIPEGLVIACGDGVLYDDMSREIALANELIIVGSDITVDGLWDNAKAIAGTYHAFMHFGTEGEKRKAFEGYIERQRTLFDSTLSCE